MAQSATLRVMFSRGASVSALAAALVLCASRILAQETGVVPYRPIFGAAAADSADGKSLTLTFNLAEADDDNLLADARGVAPSALQESGAYSLFTPAVDFVSHSDRFQFVVTGGSDVRYYQGLRKVVAVSHYAGAGFSGELTRRTSLALNSGATYAPSDLYALFAHTSAPTLGDIVSPPSEYAAGNQRNYAYVLTARLSHQLSTRAAVSFASNYRYTQFVQHLPNRPDRRLYDGSGSYTYTLDKNLKLRLGYTYTSAYYTSVQRPTEQSIAAGVEYSRPLSRTRRTQLGFTVGPVLVTEPQFATVVQRAADHYRLVGDAFLDHAIGRTWHARASYHRGLGYIDNVSAPVYMDAATVQAAGFLNRRVDVLVNAAYATGDVASGITAAEVQSYTGDARVRFGLTANFAAYVEGLYYQYAFDPSLVLAPGLAHHLKRSGVRGGVTLWLPVRSR